MKKIIVLTGKAGSGKDYLGTYIANFVEGLGLYPVRLSIAYSLKKTVNAACQFGPNDKFRDWMDRLGIFDGGKTEIIQEAILYKRFESHEVQNLKPRLTLQATADILKKESGNNNIFMDYLLKEELTEYKSDRAIGIITDMRYEFELDYLREKGYEVLPLLVLVDEDVRIQRLKERDGEYNPKQESHSSEKMSDAFSLRCKLMRNPSVAPDEAFPYAIRSVGRLLIDFLYPSPE